MALSRAIRETDIFSGATTRRRRITVAVAVAIIVGVVLAVGTVTAAQSASVTIEFLVNSLGQEADASPGDGSCATAAGECTLRAAIEESNSLQAAPGKVQIGVDPAFAGGTIPLSTWSSTWMRTTTLGGTIPGDYGAVYSVTAPVKIDLGHKLKASTTSDSLQAALFYLDGDSITVSGVDDSFASETTFYVGPDASNVTVQDGSITTSTYYPERFMVVRGGAKNIRFTNYTVQGYAAHTTEWGWGWVDGATTTPVDGLTIDHVTYNVTTGGSGCNAWTAEGCSSTPLNLVKQKVTKLSFTDNAVNNLNRTNSTYSRVLNLQSATVDDLVVSGNDVVSPRIGAAQTSLFDMGSNRSQAASIGTMTITDNRITGVASTVLDTDAVIRLPTDKALLGTGLIARNTITSEGKQAAGVNAVYWDGPFGDTTNVSDSHLTIEDNHFDGFGKNTVGTVRMYQTGAVAMQRNTFGTNSLTQSDTTREEGTTAGALDAVMVGNLGLGANGKMNTWFPTARTSSNSQDAPIEAHECAVDLEIAPPDDPRNTTAIDGARNPSHPARVDVYWTAGNTAEVFLQSVDIGSGEARTIHVPLPAAADERLASLPSGAPVPVDPATGVVSGGLRLQTQDPNAGATTVSSQYSRVVSITGSCLPAITIDQAAGQNDPTMGRDLHYTVTSSMSLDPATVTSDDIVLQARPTADTTDAARLNPRITAVTPVEGTDEREYDVVARVDDSATVTATIGAGAVTSQVGMTNTAPATSTDNQITFTNPIALTPPNLTVVTGDKKGKSYKLAIRPGAPTPTDRLQFSAVVDDAGQQHGVAVSPASPTISGGRTTSGAVTVRATDDDVPADTPVSIAHTMTTQDANYQGLVVPSETIRLFSTDPTLQITKQAYVDVADQSSPATIQATGTEAPKDSRLTDGQAVCFVYTVTNISKGDLATRLTDAVVTDTDTRLGKNGVIGTVPALSVGESVQLSACTSLIPVDTTAGGVDR
ncbi:hypothetical protein [Frigoribacterium sp. VKM Ac-2836]|uniref:hypothetical protein n=1 Tax=Frigoribacterium sp. VKM Ac-2836 TaxID=2739014 RepID=UPI001563D4B4|nr:hypothetical protein [Frigoribacterium sp. VKM Ac-2836]NRD25816.1 hypothetical protein [Frigoribacterium sp. VKM Ac-2836]